MHYSVGAGSTPLHYAACGGNMKCCQVGFYSIKWISEAWNFCFVWNDYRLVTTDPSRKRCQSDDSKLQWVIQTECFFYCRVFEWFGWLLLLFVCLMEISNGLCDYCLLFVCLMEYLRSRRWLPLDVARMWGRHWLEPLLAPNSDSTVPLFPPSNYLSLPLMSVLNIAR